ncbi:MAG: C4-dicarboxylate ABC transporter, partial [Burkholderiaceae bacterium]
SLFVVPMNKAKYDSLPADLKAVIDKNSGREFSAFLGKTQEGNDVPGKEKMIKGGHTITVIEKAELENWKKASSTIDDEWISDMNKKGFDGALLFKDAQDLIQKYSK